MILVLTKNLFQFLNFHQNLVQVMNSISPVLTLEAPLICRLVVSFTKILFDNTVDFLAGFLGFNLVIERNGFFDGS